MVEGVQVKYRPRSEVSVVDPAGLRLDTQLLGPLPIMNAFYDRLGLPALLESYLPGEDARLKLTPGTAIGVVEAARRDRIARGIAALDELNARLASPKTRMRTTVAVEQAAGDALARTGAARWITATVEEHHSERYRQEKRGRPGPDTRYRKITRSNHRVAFTIDETRIVHDAASDGMFPLISNDKNLSGAELLAVYKWQPNLEKRHAQLKGTQLVAPMFLHDPSRVEGLLCCHFIAMLIQHSSNARSVPRWPTAAYVNCRSTQKTAAAAHPPPPAYWRSSPDSPATNSPTSAAST